MKALLCLILLIGCTKNKGKSKLLRQENLPVERTTTLDPEDREIEAPTLPETLPEESPLPEVSLPSCEDFCGIEKNIFKRRDNGYNYLSFKNFGFRGIGRCRGHALVSQKMNLLAQFDSSRPRCDSRTIGCASQIRQQVQALMSFKTQTIEGYSSLYDFSLDPVANRILKSYVRGTSHRYNSTSVELPANRGRSQAGKVFFELRSRIQSGHIPYIGVKGHRTGSHALLGYKLKHLAGRDLICVKDPNLVSSHRERCENFLFLEGGVVYYKRNDRPADGLSLLSLSKDEDRRVSRYRTALRPLCLIKARSNKKCK